MDPISNVDQIVLVLRQRLQQRAKASAAKGGAVSRSGSPAAPTRLASVKALASLDGVDDNLLRRTLIQDILSDQLGPEFVNEARFQQIIDRVTETLEQDEQGSNLLSRLVSDLRRPAS